MTTSTQTSWRAIARKSDSTSCTASGSGWRQKEIWPRRMAKTPVVEATCSGSSRDQCLSCPRLSMALRRPREAGRKGAQ
eukprot:8683430-Lingulodinium_polyedra.AAC.2